MAARVAIKAVLGYDRNTPKAQSLGTPGYLKSVFIQQSQIAPVSISEIMFTAGKSKRLPAMDRVIQRIKNRSNHVARVAAPS